jgi:hypothetical protein
VAKTADELMKEAEELQREFAPELYGEEGEGTSDKEEAEIPEETPAPGDNETPAETDEEKAEAEEKPAKKESETDAPDERDAEIARLKDELMRVKATAGRVSQTAEANDRLRDRIAEMEQEIAKLKETPREPAKTPEPETDEVLAEMIDDLGEDAPAVKAYKRQKAQADSLKAEIESIRKEVGTVKTVNTESRTERFISELSGEVSDYEAIRDTPEFAAFLNEPISPLSKRTLMQELQDAAKSLDSRATAAIYKAYKDRSTQIAPENDPPAKKDKAKRLAPGSSTKAESLKNSPPVFTLAEVESKTKEMQKLRARGDHRGADKIRAELDGFLDGLEFSV